MVKGFGNILKQAQEMHAKIAQLQEEMAGRTVEASSGGGMVNIVMNGTIIPEFPMVVLPVVGLMALFVVVGLVRRKNAS